MKVSIVVAIYNCEEYLRDSILSLVNQSLKEIEIILVNDGSTDNSANICDELAKECKNIKVVHKKNGGVSSARNEGLKLVTGEYIGFIDSDDLVDANMYEELYNHAKQGGYDIVGCDAMAIYPDKDVLIKSGLYDGITPKEALMKGYAVVWNKIYKAEILKGVTFKDGYIFEDVLFTFELYPKCKKIGAIDKPFYKYLQREGSYTYTYNKKLYQAVEINDFIIEHYKNEKLYDEYKDELEYTYVRYLYGTFIKRLVKSNNKEEVKKGYALVKKKVKDKFPDFKKNKYIRQFNAKNLFLRFFSKPLLWVGFYTERNRMN